MGHTQELLGNKEAEADLQPFFGEFANLSRQGFGDDRRTQSFHYYFRETPKSARSAKIDKDLREILGEGPQNYTAYDYLTNLNRQQAVENLREEMKRSIIRLRMKISELRKLE